jgi:hypothetical protein
MGACLLTQEGWQGRNIPIPELSAGSSDVRPLFGGVGIPEVKAEPTLEQHFANGVQRAIPHGAGGAAELYANADWGGTLAGGLDAERVGSGGYQYGEIAKLLEWERLQPPAHCSTSGLQQSFPPSQGITDWLPGGAASLHLNAPLRSSSPAPALAGEFTGHYHGTQPRISNSNGFEIHQLEHLPRLQPTPLGSPLSGYRSAATVNSPPRSHLPQPAAQVPAQFPKQAASRHDLCRDAPTNPEAKSKRARFHPPHADPPAARNSPAGVASGLQRGEPMAGHAVGVHTAGVYCRAEQLQTEGARSSGIVKGGRSPQSRVGFVEDAAVQVRQAVPSPWCLVIWVMLIILFSLVSQLTHHITNKTPQLMYALVRGVVSLSVKCSQIGICCSSG